MLRNRRQHIDKKVTKRGTIEAKRVLDYQIFNTGQVRAFIGPYLLPLDPGDFMERGNPMYDGDVQDAVTFDDGPAASYKRELTVSMNVLVIGNDEVPPIEGSPLNNC